MPLPARKGRLGAADRIHDRGAVRRPRNPRRRARHAGDPQRQCCCGGRPWFATDLGPGGHAGGNLLGGGAATGSGELAFPTPDGQFTAHVQAVGWSPLSPATDGVIVNDSAGGTFCFVLPVTKGAPSHDIGVSFSRDCSLASPAPGAAGKVNPTP